MTIYHEKYKDKPVIPGAPINVSAEDEKDVFALADLLNGLGDKHNTFIPTTWVKHGLPKDNAGIGGTQVRIGAVQPVSATDFNMWIEHPSLSTMLHELGHVQSFYKRGLNRQVPRSKSRRLFNALFPAYSSGLRDILYGSEVAADNEARNFISKITDPVLRDDILRDFNKYREAPTKQYRNAVRYATGGQHLLGTLGMLGLGYGGYKWGDHLAKKWGLQDKNRGWLKALGDIALRYGGAAAGGYLGGLAGGYTGFSLGTGLGASMQGNKYFKQTMDSVHDEVDRRKDTIARLQKYLNS